MRVLAHIHTLDDADIIDRPIAAMLRQTRPVDGILIVDNGSTDGALDRPSVKAAAVLRHQQNLGTSGAVYSGFQYAIEHDYDWIWVFDADSVPEPDALEKLLDLYAGFPQSLREEVGYLSCLHYNLQDGIPQHGRVFTRRGLLPVNPAPEQRYYPCHVNIWSGCLYRLAAVRRIGLPNADYVLDWGEGEYGYRLMKAGYRSFIHQDSLLQHNIRGYAGRKAIEVKRRSTTFTMYELPPIRCYYSCRNRLYFSLYEVAEGRFWQMLHAVGSVVNLMLNFLVRPRHRGKQIAACLYGLWHGVTGKLAARY
jgi:rhamnosyltransferase